VKLSLLFVSRSSLPLSSVSTLTRMERSIRLRHSTAAPSTLKRSPKHL
jgi:hypothetical protein